MSTTSLRRIAKEAMNFYRRPLPSSCVSFSSEKGKSLFKEAMMSGQMENYFRVASQLRTQDEPSYCGLATLVMCLNALEVDPGRIWKGPWRWYHEQMLDCCIPIDLVKEKGVTLDQFVCIAKCNGLTTNLKRMSEPQKFEDFKNLVMSITRKDDEILVVSYCRKTVQQTGDGHYAPVGGFHEREEMVLLFDTARFKYPPHWVPIRLLWDAMFDIDKETGRPRGYMTLTKDMDSSCLLLLATSVQLNEYLMTMRDSGHFSAVMRQWSEWLHDRAEETESLVADATRTILNAYLSLLTEGETADFPLTCHGVFSEGIHEELETAMSAIIKEVVDCQIGTEVGEVVDRLDVRTMVRLCNEIFRLPKLHGCTLLMLQDARVRLVFLLASWMMTSVPATNSTCVPATRGAVLQGAVQKVLQGQMSPQSQIELAQLSKKLSRMHYCREQVHCCGQSRPSPPPS